MGEGGRTEGSQIVCPELRPKEISASIQKEGHVRETLFKQKEKLSKSTAGVRRQDNFSYSPNIFLRSIRGPA